MNIKSRSKQIIFPLIFFFIFTSIFTASSHIVESHSDLAPIKITILPCTDPVKAYKKFHTLAHFLEKEINRNVIIQVPRNYHAFMRIIRQNKTDFTYQSAHVYLALENSFNRNTCLSTLTPDGKRQLNAFLVTRSDSSIKKVKDLRGKSVLFGPEQSTIKTYAAKLLLQNHGINVETDLHDYSFGSSCERTAFNVYLRAFDAGFICDHNYDDLMSKEDPDWPIPPGSLKVVAETMPIPTWIFSAMRSVDISTVKRVKEALLAMTSANIEHRKVLRNIESGGFVSTDPKDLLGLREQLAEP